MAPFLTIAPPLPTTTAPRLSGATASFFDRTSNMVGSVQAWEPDQRVLVFDLGYTQVRSAGRVRGLGPWGSRHCHCNPLSPSLPCGPQPVSLLIRHSLHVVPAPYPRLTISPLPPSLLQAQVATMLCWRSVEVRPFPYDDYPPHVRDVTNYAFKVRRSRGGSVRSFVCEVTWKCVGMCDSLD